MDLTTRLFLRRPPRAALLGVLYGRRFLRSTRGRLVPANAEIIERTLALAEVRALGIVAELDVAELVAGSRLTSEELARRLEVDADALDQMLQLLASTGCFKQAKDGTWANTRVSKVLRADHPLSVREWARFFGGGPHLRIWADADVSIRTGGSATEAAMGHEFFEWVTEVEPEIGERFAAAQRDGSRILGPALDRAVDWSGVTTICDVGGGTGRLLVDLLAGHRDRRGMLFDLPAVVADAPAVLGEGGVADRVEVIGGSFFEAVPAGAERYVLVSVVHDWDDDRARTILANCRAALGEGGRVLVVEQVLEPDAPPLFARHADLLMLVLTGAGRERTDDQFRTLFAQAGLTVSRSWSLATLHTVYELKAL